MGCYAWPIFETFSNRWEWPACQTAADAHAGFLPMTLRKGLGLEGLALSGTVWVLQALLLRRSFPFFLHKNLSVFYIGKRAFQ